MRTPDRPHLFVSIAILAVGWTAGLAVYLSGLEDEQQLPFELTDASKLYRYKLEQVGGKFAVLYQEMNDFLASLWHGSRLGLTNVVLSSLLALGWFLLAPRK